MKAMKKALACALVAAVALCAVNVPAKAATTSPVTVKKAPISTTATVKGVKVKTSTKGTARVTYVKSSKKTVSIGRTITVKGVKYTVVEVSANAFKKCTKATKITLPATIKVVNKNAFKGAKKVKTITFSGKKSITIKKGAFSGLNTKKMKIKASKMSKKELAKFKKALKKAGFKGKVTK